MTTLRTSKADINRLSCSNGIWGLDEGSDHAQTLGPTIPADLNSYLQPTVAADYAAILKICDHTSGLQLAGLKVAQGGENVLDLNNGVTNCAFAGDWGNLGETGDQVITIKGGCSRITLGGVIHSTGRNSDIVVGAWSDQSAALCASIDFSNLTRADGKPITYVLGRFGSEQPRVPAGARKLFWTSLGYSLYYVAKSAAVKLGLIKGL